HNRAFAFFGGVPQRLIYDNLKTVVDAILIGKELRFNRRFMALANHYLFEPVACTPESGWEKGQVEKQVGNVREWLFTPMARFKSFELLNEWLSKRCLELAARSHPTEAARTIAQCFEQERARLRPVASDFAGYVEQMMRVSSTCLVRVDRNRYSVPADFAGKVVSGRVFANQIRLVVDGQVIAQHGRRFGRDQLIFDPWHYLPVLDKKPGALRNGAPFVEWELPKAVKAVRDRVLKQPRGDHAFVELLLAARELTLECGVVTASVVMNELRRLTAPERPERISLPEQLRLQVEPMADCSRYDHLLGHQHVH
ncbi:MAG: transposase, partial [Paucibacter sp.]|nr:transposase [Roseateles sp.]